MPTRRLTMRKIREILRLKWEFHLSNRKVADSCKVSSSTVFDYLNRAKLAGLSWPLPEDLDDNRLEGLLFSELGSKQQRPAPDCN